MLRDPRRREARRLRLVCDHADAGRRAGAAAAFPRRLRVHVQGLYRSALPRALREYRRRGLRGIVSYVESTNFDSLKSCFRMGYKVFGSIYLARLLGRHFARSSPGCEPYAFRVVIGQYTAPRAATGQSASTTPPRTQTYQS
jgi:hypothetical protein